LASSRHRRAWGLALICSTVGFYALLGIPASAHTPTRNNQHFSPEEFNGDGDGGCTAAGGVHCDPAGGADPSPTTKEAEILSDATDGFGEAYELRSVSDTTATFYEWYSCTNGQNPTLPGSACQPIATDTTADVSAAPPGSPVLHAWSGSWNIGAAGGQEGTPRDIHGSACASDARTGGPPTDTSHCILGTVNQTGGGDAGSTFANNVHLDDSSTSADHTNTSSGRIHMLIDGSGTDQRVFSDVAVHGAGLRNGQTLTIIGYTSSPSVDAVGFCFDQPTNSTIPNGRAPDGTGGGGSCTHFISDLTGTAGGGTGCHALAPAVSGADCWTAAISFPNANAEFGLSMIEFDDGNAADGITESGSGDCALDTAPDPTTDGDDCQLDKIFVTTTISGETVPGATPSPTTSPTTPPPPAGACDGTSGDDILLGTNGPDFCRGFGGDDIIRTFLAEDVANGGSGDDTIRLGGANDVGRGGTGNDLVTGGKTNDTIRLGAGDDIGKGDGGSDAIFCGPGNDVASGGSGHRDFASGNCEVTRTTP
jgi:Ca2+-binding RTX toxin-like protein